jgi:hypothetical protein
MATYSKARTHCVGRSVGTGVAGPKNPEIGEENRTAVAEMQRFSAQKSAEPFLSVSLDRRRES